jgi:hypothetical protein
VAGRTAMVARPKRRGGTVFAQFADFFVILSDNLIG